MRHASAAPTFLSPANRKGQRGEAKEPGLAGFTMHFGFPTEIIAMDIIA